MNTWKRSIHAATPANELRSSIVVLNHPEKAADKTMHTIHVEEKVPFIRAVPLSLQHLFAMFGASILVPTLFKINPAVVLLMNGVGTLIYLVLCKGKAPAYLGSSFAFLSPVFVVLGANQAMWGDNYSLALGGFIASGLVFMLVAAIIWKCGPRWINTVLPPATMGPIVALIGLELAKVATAMAGFTPDAGGGYDGRAIFAAMATLTVITLGSLVFRGFAAVISLLIGIAAGYLLAIPLGLVDFAPVSAAPIFALPIFYKPVFNFNAILVILPAALVVITEHIGHLVVTGKIIERDLMREPGLHRSLFGDGVSTVLSGFCGSVPTTTYGENIGVMAITRVYSVWVIGGAALLSIVLAFSGTLSALIQSIPAAVMGGVCILLFGVIAASGIRMLVEARVDYSKPVNLSLTAIVLIVGISEVAVKLGDVELKGMALATVVGMLLSLLFHMLGNLGLLNEQNR